MDYSRYATNTYEMRTDVNYSGTFLYFENGGSYEIPDSNYSLDRNQSMITQLALACDYHRRLGNVNSRLNFVQFTTNAGNEQYGFICPTNNIDFLSFKSSDAVDDIEMVLDAYYISSESETFTTSTSTHYLDFYDTTNYVEYDNLSLSRFDADIGAFNTGLPSKSLFSYNNLIYPDLFSSEYYIRGEDLTFYSSYLQFDVFDVVPHGFTISTGNVYRSLYQTGFDSGYFNGFGNGNVQGRDEGYQQGLQAGLSQSTGYPDAFGYIGSAFDAVGSIMSLEVLPNITLGVAFTIPMVFVLIMTIFKLVRK